VWSADSNLFVDKAFEKANQKPIGDVLQSAFMYGNTLYLVVNNSGILYALNPNTLKVRKRITGFKSPRYAAAHNGKIYISDLEANAVNVYDTLTDELKSVQILQNAKGTRSGWSEDICFWNQNIVAAVNDGFLWIFDPATSVSKLIEADTGSKYLAIDSRNRLWIGANSGNQSSLKALNQNLEEVYAKTWTKEGELTRLKASLTGDTMWLIRSGQLAGISVGSPEEEFSKVVPYTNIYGMGIDPNTGEIYVSDAGDYVSRGRWSVLNPAGDSIIYSGKTGIIPGGFVFF
jgi:streptogramin lyase